VSGRLVECVPNISEGRDAGVVDRIAGAAESVSGVWLLDRQSDADHHRSVLTFVGEPEAIVEAAVQIAGRAVELIDLNGHQGAHPRIGALDVLPFVPLRGVTLAECARMAVRAGEEIWRRHGVPVYLYEAAARREGRRNLAAVRRGQFERLREAAASEPDRRPDIGGPGLHPTAGAVAAGARRLMIAYNILLASDDVGAAKQIARAVRASSGGLPEVKAMGVALDSRGLAQVSMNLTDFRVTPPHVAFEAVRTRAEALGIGVRASEIVGLIPRKALEMAEDHDLRWENLSDDAILENRLAQVVRGAAIE
jgi:glutamate formiminotransferase